MLIKYHTHCRKSDKKVCLGETLEFQAKRAFVLVAGFPADLEIGRGLLNSFFFLSPKKLGTDAAHSTCVSCRDLKKSP